MKLANKAYAVTLIMLTLAFAAMAQPRPESDPRNTAPTAGGGGNAGGPTGLFVTYDGSVLRKGEYTFSGAISNYDRDPGNVDITSIPVSFQIGLTNYIELFFSTDAYRGIKVNSPRNLSGFYLPNSRLRVNNIVQAPPAIVLAPRGAGTPQTTGAVFRPSGAPFVQFPYFGGSAGTYGLTPPFFSGNVFGFANNGNATLGGAVAGGNGAANFYGIGSVYGGILPGLVLTTAPNVGPTGAQIAGTEVPTSFTLAPSYLNDAPLLNREYGESSFSTMNIGAKVRLTSNSNPIGAGFFAYYTWYYDKATSFKGFNQLQRGSSPGGNNGDITVGAFADARLAKWANLSSNVSYTYTSKIKGDFPGGTFTMLDRGDELRGSIGVDFPVNKYFQPIMELLSTRYVGGRTPNAFEQHPLDGLVGARVFITRWAGIGAAYRYNFNQQDVDYFSKDTGSTTVTIPCRPGQTACTPVTVTNTFTGIPNGFRESSDPHGYIFNVWVGRRDKRVGDVVNQAPSVNSVTLSDTEITLGCPPGYKSASGACDDKRSVDVATSASDPENDPLTYNYTVSGGRIVGQGANVSWDLSGEKPGTYTITTGVNDGCGVCGKTDTRTITIKECADCKKECDCASISVSGPSGDTRPGDPMTFSAIVSGTGNYTYNWTVSAGTITSGQGTPTITVDTAGLTSTTVTATVDVGGQDAACNCPSSDSETGTVGELPSSRKIDEFGPMKDDDVKARIDNFFLELNQNPNAQGYIINYGTPAQIAARKRQINKAINRPGSGHDASRVTIVDGGAGDDGQKTVLWIVPAGATPPTP